MKWTRDTGNGTQDSKLLHIYKMHLFYAERNILDNKNLIVSHNRTIINLFLLALLKNKREFGRYWVYCHTWRTTSFHTRVSERSDWSIFRYRFDLPIVNRSFLSTNSLTDRSGFCFKYPWLDVLLKLGKIESFHRCDIGYVCIASSKFFMFNCLYRFIRRFFRVNCVPVSLSSMILVSLPPPITTVLYVLQDIRAWIYVGPSRFVAVP